MYVTGNHEYFSEAQGWLDHMQRSAGRPCTTGTSSSSAAATSSSSPASTTRPPASGVAGHRADLEAALAGADPALPVLLLAHQPKQITQAVAHGVDLQISGHTHGGQIWPFHFLVRLDQPVVQGLSRHGARTQLYTSRGTGFWGPPLPGLRPERDHPADAAVGGERSTERFIDEPGVPAGALGPRRGDLAHIVHHVGERGAAV